MEYFNPIIDETAGTDGRGVAECRIVLQRVVSSNEDSPSKLIVG